VANYTVVSPKANRNQYNDLVKNWWNWVYTHNCDNNNRIARLNVTFLRDDIIGTRLVIGAGISSTPIEQLPCHTKNITIATGSDIFFPVYHVNIVGQYPYGDGKECGSLERCVKAARNDLGDLDRKWAKISVNGGKSHEITTNLDNYYFESNQFTLVVQGRNDLNREQGFYLGKGSYKGVAFGIYLLLKSFKAGTYMLDFGGTASNYRTRAVYNMTVK
jgi:hypothetical protein